MSYAQMNRQGRVISLRLLANEGPPQIEPELTRIAVETARRRRYQLPVTNPEVFDSAESLPSKRHGEDG
jgi:hypothetical protein